MIKKLLILPILGLVGLSSLSYADSVEYDGITFTSDTSISRKIIEQNTFSVGNTNIGKSIYLCVVSSDVPFDIVLNSEVLLSVSSNYFCSSNSIVAGGRNLFISKSPVSGYVLISSSPITNNYVSETPVDPDNGGSYVPGIPETFTSGLTNLINNFGSTIFNWLPTIILVALGIYAIFALFRVVRNYARSSFNG